MSTKKDYIYLIQINYKSGNSVKMWFKDFKLNISEGNREVSWIVADDYNYNNKPLFINVDEIESVWQIGAKKDNGIYP